MFFSKEMNLTEFFSKHYSKNLEYRLTLDTRTNTCVYADINIIKLPNFKKYSSIELDEFKNIIFERTWTWLQETRFKYLYVYIMKDGVYISDRDNLPIKDPKYHFLKLDKESKNKIITQPKLEKMINGNK
jgi:hypothetical protein